MTIPPAAASATTSIRTILDISLLPVLIFRHPSTTRGLVTRSDDPPMQRRRASAFVTATQRVATSLVTGQRRILMRADLAEPEQLPCRCRVWPPPLQLHAAEAQLADAYSGRRGLADHRQDARRCWPTPRARSSGMPPNTAWSIAAILFGETSIVAARARGQRTRAVRPGQAVLLDPWLGTDPRPAVSARADAARFRRASAAPPRAVGRVQIRADEVLSRRARHRHRRAGRAMEGAAGARCCSIRR